MLRALHRPNMRMFGAGHSNTLMTAGNLAESLSRLCRYADQEWIQRDVLRAGQRVPGLDDPKTLTSEGNLAMYLSEQGRYSKAAEINFKVHAAQKRALGEKEQEALSTGGNFVACSHRTANSPRRRNLAAACSMT